MSSIHLRTEHYLGLVVAKRHVEELAAQLKDRLGVSYEWVANTVEFSRPGASGTILVEERAVTLDVKLGMTLLLFKGEIEGQLKSFLEQKFR